MKIKNLQDAKSIEGKYQNYFVCIRSNNSSLSEIYSYRGNTSVSFLELIELTPKTSKTYDFSKLEVRGQNWDSNNNLTADDLICMWTEIDKSTILKEDSILRLLNTKQLKIRFGRWKDKDLIPVIKHFVENLYKDPKELKSNNLSKRDLVKANIVSKEGIASDWFLKQFE
jgi:hypothetical protein